MRKIILLFCGISFLVALSCKKNETNEPPAPNGVFSGMKTYSGFAVQRAQADIMRKLATPESKVSGIKRVTDAPGLAIARGGGGCCRTLEEASSQLVDVRNNPGCDEVTATFYWTVYETSCLGLPVVDYNFYVDPGYGTVYSGNGTLIDQYTVVINWYCCHPPGHYTVKTFSVEVVMPRSEFAASQSANTVEGSNSCATNSITDTCSLSFSYCGTPAIATVSGSGLNDQVAVYSQCDTSCSPPPHVTCPSSGTFYYRVAGSGSSWTSVSINGSYNLITISVSATTNYEYRVSYNYGSPLSCTSAESAGTFTVNP